MLEERPKRSQTCEKPLIWPLPDCVRQLRCQMYCETNPDCSFFTYYEESKALQSTSEGVSSVEQSVQFCFVLCTGLLALGQWCDSGAKCARSGEWTGGLQPFVDWKYRCNRRAQSAHEVPRCRSGTSSCATCGWCGSKRSDGGWKSSCLWISDKLGVWKLGRTRCTWMYSESWRVLKWVCHMCLSSRHSFAKTFRFEMVLQIVWIMVDCTSLRESFAVCEAAKVVLCVAC